MSILEHNLRLLNYPYLPLERPDYISLSTARNGQQTMRFLTGERWVYVHSAYDPEKEARDIAGGVKLYYDSVVVVFGAGLMYHVKALLERTYPKCRILLIEPDRRVFECMLGEIDLSSIFAKVAFSIGCDERELASFLAKEITSENFIQVTTVTLPAYMARYPVAYAEFKRTLDQLIIRRRIENNTIYGQMWIRKLNIIRNTKHLSQSIRHWTFRDVFAGRPGVVVSSGPSLDKNVELLKHLKDKALVVAAYTSLKTLKRHGITPDITVAIDSHQLIRETEAERAEPLNIPLLYTSMTHYSLVNKATGGKIFALSKNDRYLRGVYDSLGYEDGLLYPSGSVALAAVDFAVIAGCDPIIFVGQDLAYSGGRLHSADVHDSVEYTEQRLEDTIWVDGVFGEKVPVDPLMKLYRHVLEGYIAQDVGRRYIDASEGGAYIQGTEVLSLKDTIEQLRADGTSGGVKERLALHLANASNLAPAWKYAAGFLSEIENIARDIASNPDVNALVRSEMLTEELVDKAFEYLNARTQIFDVDLSNIKSRFIQRHEQDYINRQFSYDVREAYLIRQLMIARRLLYRMMQFPVSEEADIIRELRQQMD